ncbi:MAG: hypothetical protein PHO01_09690 [Desulfotomaculaceae bacterium]|nr:hypothetical protein [Desulfotomaculaceae bacterium]
MTRKSAKNEEITMRRNLVLELLATSPGGRAAYSFLKEKLAEVGHIVGERSIRDDCTELLSQGLVEKVKSGVAITLRAQEALLAREVPAERLKEKYLKQMAILKLLYNYDLSTNPDAVKKGMHSREISTRAGIGSEDTVKDILQVLEAEGLVKKEGDRWLFAPDFPRPVPVTGSEARLLYEYLNMISGMVPLSPHLASLKSKLMPVLVLPGCEEWREDLVKVMDRIIIHGSFE